MSKRIPNMNRMGRIAGLAALVGVTACDADPLRPDAARAAQVALDMSVSEPLASFGDSAIATPRVLDQHGKTMKGVRLRWSVEPAGVLVQDADGVFRAVANGRVTVIAMVDVAQTGVRPQGYWAAPVADSVVIEVRQRAARLMLDPVDTAFVTIGAARQLRVRVTDARGHPMLDEPPPLTWSSADASIASVDASGVVRSAGEGTARITVQAEQLSGSATFTVNPRLPHTSCMVYAQRRQTKQSCVTIDFVVREREAGR